MTGPSERFDLVELVSAARAQSDRDGVTVLDALVRRTGIDVLALVEALRTEVGIDSMLKADEEVRRFRPSFQQLDRSTARQLRCVVLNDADGGRWLAAADPWDEMAVQRVTRLLGQMPRLMAVTQIQLQDLLGDASDASPMPDIGAAEGRHVAASGPVVSFVDAAIKSACAQGASDVHFESDRHGMTVKLRLDGVLSRFASERGDQFAQEVISRIKVMAQLDITERRLPQDGRCRVSLADGPIDLRVSIMPSVHGEDAVLRILDKARLGKSESTLTLEQLGFGTAALKSIRELATLPSGMLLITGPTGSGKTTTVYAALSEINTGEEKIVTIEDPVEYELAGVLQIPVNERKGLTFARGLRSILRHDPDRILVGEIRDAETAEIAVQSALTGHLVFTTVHANSFADIVGRFRHFGLDMFGFMSALNGVVVQRLVRRLCERCGSSRAATTEEREWMFRWAGLECEDAPVAVGCSECRQSGFRGRFVVSEIHAVDDLLRDTVTDGGAMSAIRTQAEVRGVQSLRAQGAGAIAERRTTFEEIRRVVGWH